MSHAIIQSLRVANHNLRAGLARLQDGPDRYPAPAHAEFAGLRAEILRATDCLRSGDGNVSADPQLGKELSEYRNYVEQLVRVLPSVSGRLLTEKARLEAARAQVAKTAAWAQASKKTL